MYKKECRQFVTELSTPRIKINSSLTVASRVIILNEIFKFFLIAVFIGAEPRGQGGPRGGAGGWRVLAQGPDEQGDQMSYFRRTILLRLTAFLHCALLYLLKIVYSLFCQSIYLLV